MKYLKGIVVGLIAAVAVVFVYVLFTTVSVKEMGFGGWIAVDFPVTLSASAWIAATAAFVPGFVITLKLTAET